MRKGSVSKPAARRQEVELGPLERRCHVRVGHGRGEARLRAQPGQHGSEQDSRPHKPLPPTPGRIALRPASSVQDYHDRRPQEQHQHDQDRRLAPSQELRHSRHVKDQPVKCTQCGCATEQATER
jgi:hypothetical protein